MAILDAYVATERIVVLQFSSPVAVGLLHLVVGVPIELDSATVAVAVDGVGESVEGEHTIILAEKDPRPSGGAKDPLFIDV